MTLTKTWGPLTVARSPIAHDDPSLTLSDTVSLIAISLFDCFPPPGITTDFKKPKSIVANVISRSLEEQERRRLGQLPTLNGGPAQTPQDVLRQIKRHMDFIPHRINYAGDAYKSFRTIHSCYTSRLYLRIYHQVSEISITTSEAIKLGGEAFAAGSVIARFRIRQARRHRFEVDHTWNALCCPTKPPQERESENSDDYYSIEEIVVTGERIRRLDIESALPIVPITPEDIEEAQSGD